MKGIVFTEFFKMVEQSHGYDKVDQIIDIVKPESNGAYTSIGTYDHQELVSLIVAYTNLIGVEVDAVLKDFGSHLFKAFVQGYPQFFDAQDNAFNFLESVDSYIHLEVAKLYPDAQLPRFELQTKSEDLMEMVYLSNRKMSALALGLIESTLDHYEEQASIEMLPLSEDGSKIKFVIRKSK